jgi:hypothetical protein
MPRNKLRLRDEVVVVDSVTWHAIQLATCRCPSATTQALPSLYPPHVLKARSTLTPGSPFRADD